MGKQKSILSAHQQELFSLFSKESSLCKKFYLGGGTALSEFYLQHRLSEDLDFFSEEEVDTEPLFVFLRSVQKRLGIKMIDFEQSFNRNLFFLKYADGDVLKAEWTWYPFPRIESGKTVGKLAVDSLLDIAVNKVFTMYQKPRARDFIDLYFIVREGGFTLSSLVKKAQVKFDWHVDPIQLGAQFLQAEVVKDYPRMIQNIESAEWQNFFIVEAKKLQKNIFE
ncbi:MAG: nucleotidyl transferase AbiEii/AbiGii toxin family protein [Patescibacteria group bacterium]